MVALGSGVSSEMRCFGVSDLGGVMGHTVAPSTGVTVDRVTSGGFVESVEMRLFGVLNLGGVKRTAVMVVLGDPVLVVMAVDWGMYLVGRVSMSWRVVSGEVSSACMLDFDGFNWDTMVVDDGDVCGVKATTTAVVMSWLAVVMLLGFFWLMWCGSGKGLGEFSEMVVLGLFNFRCVQGATVMSNCWENVTGFIGRMNMGLGRIVYRSVVNWRRSMVDWRWGVVNWSWGMMNWSWVMLGMERITSMTSTVLISAVLFMW